MVYDLKAVCPECVRRLRPAVLDDAGADERAARQQVAAALGAEQDRVFFTSGGTEADNWAVFGTVKRLGKRGKHIITTAIEHHAILNCTKELESQGYRVTYLKPDSQGNITPDALKEALTPDTILVSIMMVNNEVGSVSPIRELARLTHRVCPDAIFHTDAVQGFLKLPFQAKTLGADLISISSHKVHGPKGAGALYISPRLKSFPPLLLGGGQESGYRSGTEATPAVFGFGADTVREAQALLRDRATAKGENVMYFETGQGSELSSNAHYDTDQVTMEARCYGFAKRFQPFLVNTVVGFIGPEYLYDARQVTRAGLEDHFMGKLTGISMGCDCCYTNHMKADQNDIENLASLLTLAGCNYFMGIPHGDDIMLNYQTTGFRETAALREITGKTAIPEFQRWLEKMGFVENGHLTKKAGDGSSLLF